MTPPVQPSRFYRQLSKNGRSAIIPVVSYVVFPGMLNLQRPAWLGPAGSVVNTRSTAIHRRSMAAKRPKHSLGLVFAGVLLSCSALGASSTDSDFYEGKRITLVINFSVGGPTDIEGRLIARHLGKHIPGNPRIVVKNVPGAGGITGANYMAEVAKPDGLTVAHFAPPLMQYLLNDPGLRADITEFVWLGGTGHPQICFIRRDAGSGIDSADDLIKVDGFAAAGNRPTTSTSIRTRMALDLLGANYRFVSGYRGFANIVAGIMQNEVQFSCGSIVAFRQNVEPNLTGPGHALPLWYFAVVNAEGEQIRDPSLEGIPTFIDVYSRLKGEKPSGMLYDTFERLNNISVAVLRASLVPAGTPQEAIRALRQAWEALEHDEEFAADHRRMFKAPANFVQAPAVKALVDDASTIPPGTIDFISRFAGN